MSSTFTVREKKSRESFHPAKNKTELEGEQDWVGSERWTSPCRRALGLGCSALPVQDGAWCSQPRATSWPQPELTEEETEAEMLGGWTPLPPYSLRKGLSKESRDPLSVWPKPPGGSLFSAVLKLSFFCH